MTFSSVTHWNLVREEETVVGRRGRKGEGGLAKFPPWTLSCLCPFPQNWLVGTQGLGPSVTCLRSNRLATARYTEQVVPEPA